MKRIFLLFVIILAGCSKSGPAMNPDPNHTHADFALFIEGERMDFSDAKYMSHGDNYDKEEHEAHGHQHDYLHLHDGVDHLIHRHKSGLSVGEFFGSLGMQFTSLCMTDDTGRSVCRDGSKRWRLFINGEERAYNPNYVFKDMDQVLFTFGSDDAQIAEQIKAMTNDACIYSHTCPERGDAPVEGCISDPEMPCVVPPEDL